MTTTIDGKIPPVVPDSMVTSWAERAADVDPADGDYTSAMVVDATEGLEGPRVSDSLAAAKNLAVAAQASAASASAAAAAAQDTADLARADASTAQSAADAAATDAAAAQSTANTALSAAGDAQDTADAASSSAANAQTAADTASAAAATAQTTANAALAAANADDQAHMFLASLVSGTQANLVYRKGAVTITRIDYVMDGSLTIGSATITPRIDGVDITDGAVTITTGQSGAGNSFSASPTANRSLTTGDKISLHVTGLNASVTRMAVTYTLQK